MLFLAVSKLVVIAVDKIMNREPLLYSKDPTTGDYPVHLLMALFQKNVLNAKRIVEIFNHYKIDFMAMNNENWAPIHVAVKRGFFEAVETLVKLNDRIGDDNL